MKKLLLTVLILTLCLTAAIPASAGNFGIAAEVLASRSELVKTGLRGEKLTFSDADFKSAFSIADFKSITINELPNPDDGVLYLGDKSVSRGETIKRRNVAKLYFMPKDRDVIEAEFEFTVKGSSETDSVCKMKFIGAINLAPKIGKKADSSLSVTTQRGISVYGKIDAHDPEGDEISIITVVYPKCGNLTFSGEEFKYTPDAGFSGEDEFVIVLRDEYGNYSDAERVKLKITERMSEVVYVDMSESKSYNAAVAMTAMGIMSGKRVGDDMYFMPEEGVTRAEFCAMAMKALSVKADPDADKTFFDDNDDIPRSLVSYVATAARRGIVNGSFDGNALNFRPNDNITFLEAAIIMSNLLEVEADAAVYSSVSGIMSVPVYARGQVGAMFEAGVFSYDEEYEMSGNVTREAAAEFLYRIMK